MYIYWKNDMIDEHGGFATWFVAFLIMGKLWEIIDG